MTYRELVSKYNELYRVLKHVQQEVFMLKSGMSSRIYGREKLEHLYEHDMKPFTDTHFPLEDHVLGDSDSVVLIKAQKSDGLFTVEEVPPGVVVLFKDFDTKVKQVLGRPLDFNDDIIKEISS